MERSSFRELQTQSLKENTVVAYLPSNLDLEGLLAKHNEGPFYLYAYFCNILVRERMQKRHKEPGDFFRLSSKILQKMLTHEKATTIIQNLQKWKVIEVNESYKASNGNGKGWCKGYRFTRPYRDQDIKSVALTNKPLKKRVGDWQKENLNNVKACPIMAYLFRQFLRLRLTIPQDLLLKWEEWSPSDEKKSAEVGLLLSNHHHEVPITMHNTSASTPNVMGFSELVHQDGTILPSIQKHANSKNTGLETLRLKIFYGALNNKEPYLFHRDNNVHRLHTNLTILDRKFRRFLRLDSGEDLVSVDVGECQPFMLAALILSGEIKEIAWSKGLPSDVCNYIELTTNRQFYNYMMKQCDVAAEERDTFKRLMFSQVFYCTPFTNRLEENIYSRAFESCFPNLYKVILRLKQNKGTHPAVKMLRMESELMIDRVAANFAKEQNGSLFCATIHDSIVTTKANVGLAIDLIAEAFKTRLGVIPTINQEAFGE